MWGITEIGHCSSRRIPAVFDSLKVEERTMFEAEKPESRSHQAVMSVSK